MAYLPQQVMPQGVTSFGTAQNMVSTAPPVIIMVPTPAPMKQKVQYEKRFPKKIMLALSSIQLAMAILAIITQVVGLSVHRPEAHYIGHGIWCGLFFGFSGMFGIIASMKPSFATIVTFMVFSIIASALCLPLLVISSIGTAMTGYYRHYRSGMSLVMFAIQIIISLIQAITAIASAAMTCKATCSCCRSNEDSGVVYYTNNGANGINNIPSQQILSQQLQPGYITIPISQLQNAAAGGATALPTENSLRDNPTADTDSPPPKYETVAELEDKFAEKEEGDGSKYQRFQ